MAKLFKTTGGKYVLGVETCNDTEEEYVYREGWVAPSLQELVELLEPNRKNGYLDNDVLAEIFEETEIADSFVEQVD